MPREASKCREWEKGRRDRLKECFTQLSKHLPTYDPSVTFSKIEILEKATKHIVDLQSKTAKLLVPEDTKKAEKNEIKILYDRIKKLLLRNEQLSNLLKDAGIKIPKEIGIVKKFKSPLPWSNKITPEQAKILARKEAQRESNKSKLPQKKVCKAKPKIKVQGVKLKFKKCESKKPKKLKSSKSLIVITRPAITSNSCFIITNAPSKALPSTRSPTVVTNSNLLTTPLVAATVKPPSVAIIPKKNTPLSSLGPGTLILANGNVVPVLPSIPTLLPTVSSNILTNQPIIVNNTPNNNTILVVKTTASSTNTININTKKKPGVNNLPVIKPKMRSLKNVPPNKVPIPPLSSCKVENKIDGNNTNKKEQQKETVAAEGDNKSKKAFKRKVESNISSEEKRLKNQETIIENKEEKSNTNSANSLLSTTKVSETSDKNEPKEKDCNKKTEKDTSEAIVNNNQTPQEIIVEKIVENTVDVDVNAKKNINEKEEPPQKEPETVLNTQSVEDKSGDKIVETNKLELNLPHSELSNDIFASLQVPTGAQNPESTSPTAAFLLAFPLVSTLTGVKVSEVIEEENSDSQRGTPTLLQIGTMDTTKPTQSQSESLTPNLLNLDNFSFFSSANFYSGFDNFLTTTSTVTTTSAISESVTKVTASKTAIEPPKNNETQKVAMQNKNDIKYNINEPVNSSKSNFVYCNTFNPFMDVSKPNNLYTDNNQYYSNAESNVNQQQDYVAASKTSMNKSDSYLYYENTCGDFNKVQQFPDGYCSGKEKYSGKNKSNPRPPVNWMTTPDIRQQIVTTSDYLLPSVDFTNTSIYSSNSFVTNTQQNYFNTNAPPLYSAPSELNTSFSVPANFQRNDDGHFCWPLETQHNNFVSSTLPTLVGDLALGNTNEKDSPKNLNKPKESLRKNKLNQPTYDNHSNLFSVSQLVDHSHTNKTAEVLPARTSNRRNSGSRSKSNIQQKSQKRLHKNDNKDYLQNQKQQYLPCSDQNWLTNANKTQKNASSNYSAEALIGQQKSTTKPFLSENIMPYYSSIDLQQEQNQNYQSGSFSHSFVSTIQNSTYSTNSFANTSSISTNYLPATNFMSEIDYGSVISDNINLFPHPPNKQFNKNLPSKVTCGTNRTEERKSNAAQNSCTDNSANLKKPKRKPPDSNLPTSGFVDFSFLSMPSSINSPILPDDFHAHANFLPPPAPSQLYPCKNPLYPKQSADLTTTSLLQFPPPVTRSNNVQPEISPSVNNIGTSLANFNLSTIFPEINKGPLNDVYGDSSRNKNFVSHRNYLPPTPQIPFNKSSFSSSYISTPNSFSNG